MKVKCPKCKQPGQFTGKEEVKDSPSEHILHLLYKECKCTECGFVWNRMRMRVDVSRIEDLVVEIQGGSK